MNDEEIDRETMETIHFGGLDPCEWAKDLDIRLSLAAAKLKEARRFFADSSRDVIDATDLKELAAIRSEVTAFLTEIYQMFGSMPMMQVSQEPLEALKYIVASIADVERGAAPAWLIAKPTKTHPEKLDIEGHWLPIITSLVLLQLKPAFASVSKAAQEVSKRTGRRKGTIMDWYYKMYHPQKCDHPAARDAIEAELAQVKAMLMVSPDATFIIERRVGELLR